jgi:hypothetical protein
MPLTQHPSNAYPKPRCGEHRGFSFASAWVLRDCLVAGQFGRIAVYVYTALDAVLAGRTTERLLLVTSAIIGVRRAPR